MSEVPLTYLPFSHKSHPTPQNSISLINHKPRIIPPLQLPQPPQILLRHTPHLLQPTRINRVNHRPLLFSKINPLILPMIPAVSSRISLFREEESNYVSIMALTMRCRDVYAIASTSTAPVTPKDLTQLEINSQRRGIRRCIFLERDYILRGGSGGYWCRLGELLARYYLCSAGGNP